MKQLSSTSWILLETGPSTAPWMLLVIDDDWGVVKDFAASNSFENDFDCQVEDFLRIAWERADQSVASETALLRLVRVVREIDSFRAVAFIGFPPDRETLDTIVGSLKAALREGGQRIALAALVDVFDNQRALFEDAEAICDQAGIPLLYRGTFSVGGWSPRQSRLIAAAHRPYVEKRWVEHDDTSHFDVRARIQLERLIGFHSDAVFMASTRNTRTHDPSALSASSLAEREGVALALQHADSHGIWLWASTDLGTEDGVPDELVRRWAAAKAFAKTPRGEANRVPVLALYALISGIATRAALDGFPIRAPELADMVSNVKELVKIDQKDHRRIDRPRDYGLFRLRSPANVDAVFESFGKALKEFMLSEEHRLPGRDRLARASVEVSPTSIAVALQWDGPALRTILGTAEAGTANHQLKALRAFAHKSTEGLGGDTLVLNFERGVEHVPSNR